MQLRPDFTLTEDNAAAVAEICRRLEGLPLAIELAAARTRLLDPRVLLRRLARSLDALGTGSVDMPERQHTLRATVDWSLSLLDDTERSLLETSAVFVDGWTDEAAAEVAGLEEDRALELSEGAGQSQPDPARQHGARPPAADAAPGRRWPYWPSGRVGCRRPGNCWMRPWT